MKRFFGFINALPLSILMWILTIILYLTKNVDRVAVENYLFIVDMKENGWFFQKLFKNRGFLALGFGNTVLVYDIDSARKTRILKHEKKHCSQCFKWGILFPVLYFFDSVRIYFFEKESHPYYDNIFEIQARDAADQLVAVSQDMWKVDRWFFF
jgi:hypothetical protein